LIKTIAIYVILLPFSSAIRR